MISMLYQFTLRQLFTTIVAFNLFYYSIKPLILGMKLVIKHQEFFWFQIKQILVIFNPFNQVENRGSETQLQVVKSFNKLTLAG